MCSQQAVTKEMFDKLTPKSQGFWWHMQNHWNDELPRECPYPQGSVQRQQWVRGQVQAIKETEGSMEALG